MALSRIFLIGLATTATIVLHAQEPQTLKQVKDRTERGSLSDQRQIVRGDTGKWSDKSALQHAPPIQQKPPGVSLDDWADQVAEKNATTTAGDDNWLIFRTRQLDDNDRVWIERIERHGNEFTVVLHEAIWQGKYFKTFTYHEVTAVNLGALPPGNYTVKYLVKSFTFKQLEKPREAQQNFQTNWPIDEQPAAAEAIELHAAFSVQ